MEFVILSIPRFRFLRVHRRREVLLATKRARDALVSRSWRSNLEITIRADRLGATSSVIHRFIRKETYGAFNAPILLSTWRDLPFGHQLSNRSFIPRLEPTFRPRSSRGPCICGRPRRRSSGVHVPHHSSIFSPFFLPPLLVEGSVRSVFILALRVTQKDAKKDTIRVHDASAASVDVTWDRGADRTRAAHECSGSFTAASSFLWRPQLDRRRTDAEKI